MKKLLFILLLLPNLLFSQTDSWVRFQVQFDFYAPTESNFFMVSDSTLDSTFYYQPTQPYEYLDTIINLMSGDYTISLTDNFGDGWISQQPASFKMKNICQGLIINWDPVLGSFYLRDTTVTILPCAPPSTGCTDPNALNYDSLATLDDGSCTYPPCGGFLTSGASQQCLPGGQTLVSFNWTRDTTNLNCDIVRFWYSNADGIGPFQFFLNPRATDFAVYAGNGQMPPNWSVEHYGVVEFADGSLSDTIAFTPISCIEGCTDPSQPTYNPWATIDDGSCSGTTCDYTEHQVTMEITFDNWPNETSWEMYSGGVVIDSAILGTYSFNDVGQTYTYTFCTNQTLGFELVVADNYGDGMAGSTSGGSMDGMIVIYDCNGDTIWYMDNPGFGDTLSSGTQFGVACNTYVDVYGCMDDDYQEYDILATIDDSSCANLHIYGCTDSAAFNYDSTATLLDLIPDCQYQLWIGDAGGDGWGNSYIGVYQNGINFGTFTMGPGSYQDSFLLVLDAGIPVHVYYFEVGGPQQPPEEVQFQTWHNSFKLTNANNVILMYEGQNPFANNGQGALQSFAPPFWTVYQDSPYCGDYCIEGVLGCMDPLSFNYDSTANIDDGSCIPFILGCTNTLAFNYNPLANLDDGTCIPISYGCLDTTADNYNALANTDDGSCYYIGCTDTLALNYDPTATVNNGCVYPIYGCTDPLAFNYDASANADDGSCIPVVLGCTDPTALNYDLSANVNIGCIYPILGCTDPSAFNFNINANVDDGSCVPYIYGCTDSTAYNYDPIANTNVGCIYPIYGCTDPNAFNYDPLANTDDNSCTPFIYGCMDVMAFNYNPAANTDNGSCVSVIYGCTDSTMFNFDPLANTDNATCIPFIYGCTDNTALNFDLLANTLDNSCCYIGGCTDPIAVNYDSDACFDDGSCVTPISGCTDVSAYNYDPTANVSDTTACLYDAGCYGGPGIPYWLNDGCYAWVIDVDNYCCTNDWDANCQSMYNYCELGWPTSLENLSTLGIRVYPNPAQDIVNIDTRLNIEVELYNITGELILKEKNIKRIDMNSFPSGIYHVIIIYQEKRFINKIIKQ